MKFEWYRKTFEFFSEHLGAGQLWPAALFVHCVTKIHRDKVGKKKSTGLVSREGMRVFVRQVLLNSRVLIVR